MTNDRWLAGHAPGEGRAAVRPDARARQAALDKVLRQIGELNRRMAAPQAPLQESPVRSPGFAAPQSAAADLQNQASQPHQRTVTLPDAAAAAPAPLRIPEAMPVAATAASDPAPAPAGLALPATPTANPEAWRIGPVLGTFGLLPRFATQLEDRLRQQHGATPPPSLHDELALAGEVLFSRWRTMPNPATQGHGSPALHVFVGAPGVGKTTCLCKWLAQAVLLEGRTARVWRLDGRTANTAASLSLYAEVLGVPVQRAWTGPTLPPADMHFIDWPGVDWRHAAAVTELAERVRGLGDPQVHLVLNAAYDTPLWLAQVAAFQGLPIRDLILTHLDEEVRWTRLWNLVLGTQYALAFLSAGQNVPGEFHPATPERLWSAGSGAIPPLYAPGLPA